VDRKFFGSPIYWSYDVDAGGLRRSQPGFVTPGVVGRADVDPDVSLPIFYKGWTFRPDVQLRNTVYSQQESTAQGITITHHNVLNRRTIATSVDLRPPVLSKIFDGTIAGATPMKLNSAFCKGFLPSGSGRAATRTPPAALPLPPRLLLRLLPVHRQARMIL
jgi:hypothetical protein